MVIDDTGSVEDIHAFIYCKKWRSGQVLPMPHSLTDSHLKDRATQLLIKYKSGALVTQNANHWKVFSIMHYTNKKMFGFLLEVIKGQYPYISSPNDEKLFSIRL